MKKGEKGKRLVHGVGINDAGYTVYTKIKKGNTVVRRTCPLYRAWTDMLKRAYCPKYHERQPTYKDVSVCDEWLLFSNFRKWAKDKYEKGLELDKDIIVEGNRIYRPEFCAFVTRRENSLFRSPKKENDLPLGVYYNKKTQRYWSEIYDINTGKKRTLGTYPTPEEAHKTWCKEKAEIVLFVAETVSKDVRVKKALNERAKKLRAEGE